MSKKVKIWQKQWSCLDCKETIKYYPDIQVFVHTEHCDGENHFCSTKCLKNYLSHLSLIDSENPKDACWEYNNRERKNVSKTSKLK